MVSEDAAKVRKIVIMVILFTIFLYLAVYTGAFIFKIYTQTKAESDTIAEKAYDCSLVSFNVLKETVTYNDGMLSFKIKNSIGEPFEILVVDTGADILEYSLIDFRSGTEPQTIKVQDSTLTGTIDVYPKGCTNAKKVVNVP